MFSFASQMSEEEYHNYNCLCYSELAHYKRKGTEENDANKSNSVTLGSAFDRLITEPVNFSMEFAIAEKPSDGSKKKLVCEYIAKNTCSGLLRNVDLELFTIAKKEFDYYANEDSVTIRNRLLNDNKFVSYFGSLISGKKIISTEEYFYLTKSKESLRENEFTNKVLFSNLPQGVERHFQEKFFCSIEGLTFKCMFDCLIVDFNKKTIYMFDLKTTGKPGAMFKNSIREFRYDIQARLYYKILRTMLNRNSMGDWKISNFTFIVINLKESIPFIVEFKDTKYEGDLDMNGVISQNPISIAKEYVEFQKEADKNKLLYPNVINDLYFKKVKNEVKN